MDTFDYRLKESNNKIFLSIDENLPEYIKCDKVRLSQILINLVGNSVKFTQNGKIDLRAKLITQTSNNVKIRFEVEDNGDGIPKSKFKEIFQNFSQLENSNNNIMYQSTGLGLSITKQLVKLFNSKIELESDLGIGTKFSFNVELEIEKNTKIILVDRAKTIKSTSCNKGYKILVAEDNKINQIVTKNLLKRENHQCTIVGNGAEAVEAIENGNFDVVLMDIHMPVMDGNTATKKIRKFNKFIPIIALTAADIEEVKENYNDTGINANITKTLDDYEYFQTMEQLIQQRHKEQSNNLGKVS